MYIILWIPSDSRSENCSSGESKFLAFIEECSPRDAWFDPVSYNQISQLDSLVSLHVMLAAAEVNSALNHQEKFKVSWNNYPLDFAEEGNHYGSSDVTWNPASKSYYGTCFLHISDSFLFSFLCNLGYFQWMTFVLCNLHNISPTLYSPTLPSILYKII